VVALKPTSDPLVVGAVYREDTAIGPVKKFIAAAMPAA
jgi:hypothetical protein